MTQGARQRHFILWFRVVVVNLNLKHSVRYDESLVVSLFEKPDFTQANYIYQYLDLLLLVNRESDYNSRITGQPGIHRASAHYRRRLS